MKFSSGDGVFSIDNVRVSQGETSCTASEPAYVALNLDIHIPSAKYQSLGGTSDIWVDLEFKGVDSDGDYIWRLKNFDAN